MARPPKMPGPRRKRVFSAMPKRERLRRQAALAEKRKKQGQEEQPGRRRRKKKNAGNDPVMEEEASSLWRSPSVELMITIDDDVPSIDRCFTTDSPEFTAWLLTMREAVMGGDE